MKKLNKDNKQNKVYPFAPQEVAKHIKKIFSKKTQACRIFKEGDRYVFCLATGKSIIRIDPKPSIKEVAIRELDEYCDIGVCNGCGQNIFNSKVNKDFIEICCDVKTNCAVIEVFVR